MLPSLSPAHTQALSLTIIPQLTSQVLVLVESSELNYVFLEGDQVCNHS